MLDQLNAELLEIALEAARRAGALLRDGRPADLGVAATKSSPIDVVTEMDIASEKLITGFLAERRPDDGLLGEEGAVQRGTSGVRWVIDPIDGTVNYLYGLPTWAVSIAAEQGRRDRRRGRRTPRCAARPTRPCSAAARSLNDRRAALPARAAARAGARRHRLRLPRRPPGRPGRGGRAR